MVEIREESSEPYNEAGPSSSTNPGASQSSGTTQGTVTLSQYVSANLMECCMNAARVLTLFFSLCYLLPFLSPVAPDSAYYKAFAAAAATNALRMQQRIGSVSLSREFLARIMLEDSCHYLLYSVLFLTSHPVTMALLPVALFAALHTSNFATKVMASTGSGGSPLCGKLLAIQREHTPNCLGIIACAEIFLVPILISMIFVGKGALLMPFVYYRFLTLRYASRRNPYTRQAMYQMRCSLHQVASSPRCPAPVSALINRSITFISSLAPAF